MVVSEGSSACTPVWRPPDAAPGCACVHVCTNASSAPPPLGWPGAKGLWAGLDWTAFFGSVRGQPALSMLTKRCPSSCRRGQLAGCCPAPEWWRGSWSQGRVCGATAARRRWGGTGLTRRSLWPGVGCWNTWGGEWEGWGSKGVGWGVDWGQAAQQTASVLLVGKEKVELGFCRVVRAE